MPVRFCDCADSCVAGVSCVFAGFALDLLEIGFLVAGFLDAAFFVGFFFEAVFFERFFAAAFLVGGFVLEDFFAVVFFEPGFFAVFLATFFELFLLADLAVDLARAAGFFAVFLVAVFLAAVFLVAVFLVGGVLLEDFFAVFFAIAGFFFVRALAPRDAPALVAPREDCERARPDAFANGTLSDRVHPPTP